MPENAPKARDLRLLDAIDAFQREPFEQNVWRVTTEGRDPLQGSPSLSRWCNGTFDVLYSSCARDGAVAEIFDLWNAQPVFPSKIRSLVHRVRVNVQKLLHLRDNAALAGLGVDPTRYKERCYEKTQAIADAAYFLGFDGLIAPSARWECMNVVLFTDHIPPGDIELAETEPKPVDWEAWRRTIRGPFAGRR